MITSIERYLWIAAVVVIVAFGFYVRQHLIDEGEAKCLQREKAAADKQAMQDSKIAQDTVDELQREISRLRGGSIAAPPVRVQCYARKVPAERDKPAAAGESAAPSGIVPEVPAGPGAGVEVGASLQRFALAADLLSARYRACLKELQEP